MPDSALWRLERFLPELDAWADREHPSDDLRLLVTAWIVEAEHLVRCNSFATLGLPL